VILVVDHNPSLLARAQRAFPNLMVVANTHRQGASGGRNTGGELATGDVIVFLDDDARASPSWLSQLMRPFEESGVAGVGGQAIPLWPQRRPSWFPPEFDWVVGCSYVGLPASGGQVRNPIGTNMAVRRELLTEVGGFREGFGNIVATDGQTPRRGRLSTGEETDFCIRVSQVHPELRWIYEPSATVHHRVPAERASFKFFVSRCWIEGKGKAALKGVLVGSQTLASEREYVRRVLPRGIRTGLAEALAGRVGPGLGRAGAIGVGLGVTCFSYGLHRAAACLPYSGRDEPPTLG
jgi:glycosyltransferase involved in cell wall biosynthesis